MDDDIDRRDTSPAPACRRTPETVWDEVREAYLDGMSAPACCRRYGVGLSALRQRAAREHWRRADQPWIAPNLLDADDEGVVLEQKVGGDLDRVELCELSFVAHRRMLRAVMRGNAVEALRWHRVEAFLDAKDAEFQREFAQQEAVEYTLRGIQKVHDLHDLHGVSDTAPEAPDAPAAT